MSDMETAVRAEIEQVVRGLEALQAQLQRILSKLPVSEREDVMYAGEEDFDFPTEARSVIECVLSDWIGPAIRDLREAAAYNGKSRQRA
jgi:hypothetical protein